jgi:hypothetical protein
MIRRRRISPVARLRLVHWTARILRAHDGVHSHARMSAQDARGPMSMTRYSVPGELDLIKNSQDDRRLGCTSSIEN